MKEEERFLEEKTPLIQQVEFDQHMTKSFLSYAVDVIEDRALPSVSDGLKPVQRRILQSMHSLGLHPNSAYKKCARTVGDCLGRLHPHGDQSVYDAMVVLAQDFKERYPLVDGHGNFGSLDGDRAAAMRYTEARLSPIGELLMTDMDKKTVDMKPNYDESEMEASELSGLFPTLLANGSSGIAVGMACSFVPHRAKDVYAAVDKVIENTLAGEETDDEELISIVKAPDFPTGGVITNLADVYKGYLEGKGTVHISAKYHIDEDKHGRQSVIITEIPYGVNKAKMILKMDALRKEGELSDIKEIRDESGKDGIRVVIELKKGANEQFVLNKLLKKTEMSTTVSMNHQALVHGKAQERLTLKQLVEYFLEHALSVVHRKAQFLLGKQEKRYHIVSGFLTIAPVILEAVQMITEAETDEDVFRSLNEAYGLDKEQVDAICARQLRSLKKLNEAAYAKEAEELSASIEHLTAVATDDMALLNETRADLQSVAERFQNEPRLSEISTEDAVKDITDRDLIAQEDLVVMLTHKGLVKSVKLNDYNAQGRNGKGVSAKTQEDDFVETILTLTNHDDLVFLTNLGKAYIVPAFKIPVVSKNSIGKYVQNFVDFAADEKIISVLPIKHGETGKTIFFASRKGVCKRLAIDDLPSTKSGAVIIKFRDDDELVACTLVEEEDTILLATANGMAMRTRASNVRVMGRNATGSTGIKFKHADDYVVSAIKANDDDIVLIVAENGIGKRMKASEIRLLANKGGKGVTYYRPNRKTGSVVNVLEVKEDETVFAVTQQGMIIRLPASSISILGRTAGGVGLVSLKKSDVVASVSTAPEQPEDEADADE